MIFFIIENNKLEFICMTNFPKYEIQANHYRVIVSVHIFDKKLSLSLSLKWSHLQRILHVNPRNTAQIQKNCFKKEVWYIRAYS